MSNALSVACHLNLNTIPASNQPQLIYLLVETGLNSEITTYAPVNLGLVMDVSESMRIRLVTEAQFQELAAMGLAQEVMADGVPAWQMQNLPRSLIEQFPRKIDFMITALHTVLEQLRANDQVSLVVFAGRAQVTLPTTSGRDKRHLLDTIARLEGLDLGSDTYMGVAMTLSFQEMWRSSLSERVNRMILLTDGFTRDLAACWETMEQARRANITISTIGVGDEFNEELLIPMAEKTGGQAYFVQDPSEIPDVFRQEFGMAQNIGYRRTELKIHLTPGVELRQVYRVKPLLGMIDPGANHGGSYTILLGDLTQENLPALLFELIVPPKRDGRFRMAQLLLSSDPVGANRQTTRQDAIVDFAAEAGPVNGKVMNIVERAVTFRLQTRALEDAAVGDMVGATRKLQAAATRLLNMGETELAQTAQQQAVALNQQMQLDTQATKRLRYDTRKLTQKLT
jgi:Ca-activated chloride channel homolog